MNHGFRRADAAPIITAITIPRPAPRDAPTAAAVTEPSLFGSGASASFAGMLLSLSPVPATISHEQAPVHHAVRVTVKSESF
jgi:hypothetical protein